MTRICMVAMVACASIGCRGDDRKATPPVSSASTGSDATGSAATSSPATGSPATATPEMRAFCLRSMEQIKKCFNDGAFWDAHATTFFAAQKQPLDLERKQQWIGMYKDSFATLVRDKELEQNCNVMLSQNLLPTQKQMELVDQAIQQSCAAFGGALGYVLFSEGAFYRPRDGTTPSKLE